MHYIKPFDPWKSRLCTCPPKYSFNPYTGCSHRCVYCYATYIPHFEQIRLKKNLFKKLEKDLQKLPKNALISMSNSSDPYPPIEKDLEITRKCLEIMKDYDVRVLIVTKGVIFTRDLKLLSEMRSAVSVTITGCDKAELSAPKTEERIKAFKELKDYGIPAILRFDPIIPYLNEDKIWIIERCEPDHVVTSTLKLRRDIFSRFIKVFPELRDMYKRIYFVEGEKVGSYYYLNKFKRLKMLSRVEEFCKEIGITCAFCREGFEFKAESCDGSHLIR